MKVALDREKCTGLGICESLAPDHFEIAEDGTLVLLRDDVTTEVEDAVQACPTVALRLT